QFVHARFHSRRHVARAGGVRGHGKSTHHRFDGVMRWGLVGIAVGGSGGGARTWLRNIKAEAHRVFFARFQVTEHRADGITYVLLHEPFLDAAAASTRDVHRSFVRFDFEQVLIGFDRVANLREKADDGGL